MTGGRLAELAFVTVPKLVLGTLMLTGVAIVFANVVGRYAFGQALYWAEETLVFLTIWGVFIGMGAIAYNGDHLNMDLFSARVGGRARLALNAVVTALLLVCCLYMVWISAQVVMLFAKAGQVSVAASVPKAIPHAALPAGFALMVLAVVVRWRAYLNGSFR